MSTGGVCNVYCVTGKIQCSINIVKCYDHGRKKMHVYKIITTFFVLIALFGCATGSSIVTGKVRPAINPTEVEIYLDPPLEYDTIGIVEASSDVEFSTQAAQDRVINELKSQAAKIGANGVLLMTTGDVFYSGGSGSETKTAKGKAIFVLPQLELEN